MKELRERAIRLLARREHTRRELFAKLAGHGDEEAIARVLADLEKAGLLSDERAAAAYVRARAGRYGRARLFRALAERGVAPEIIEQALDAELADEFSRAKAVWEKKFGTAPRDAREWAKQARFLAGRGFAPELIRRLLASLAP